MLNSLNIGTVKYKMLAANYKGCTYLFYDFTCLFILNTKETEVGRFSMN